MREIHFCSKTFTFADSQGNPKPFGFKTNVIASSQLSELVKKRLLIEGAFSSGWVSNKFQSERRDPIINLAPSLSFIKTAASSHFNKSCKFQLLQTGLKANWHGELVYILDDAHIHPAKKIWSFLHFFDQMAQKWPKMAQSGPNMTQNDPKWPKNDPNMTPNCPKWP